ncbi:hypothetical protein C8Q80DRAFT_1115729 [Daedaleopsis nitida]|nr:hypothetical protein C8Q80DRAFT_1115729 [Daedaleopsis nitida]
MYSRRLALLAISASPLLASAVPVSLEVVTLPIPTQLGFPGPSTTVTLSDAVSFVNEKSADIASMVGTPALMGIEATLGLMQASIAIDTATSVLTAFITDVSSTPVVQVSSIGGDAITLATGTVGDTTTFAGQVFTAAPQQSNAASGASSAAGDYSCLPPYSMRARLRPRQRHRTAALCKPPRQLLKTNVFAFNSSNTTTKNNGAGSVMVPRSMFVSAAGVLVSIAAGAMAVL